MLFPMELKQKDIEMNVEQTSFFFGTIKRCALVRLFWKKTEVVEFDQSEKSKKKVANNGALKN
jgi:hypothetical protein